MMVIGYRWPQQTFCLYADVAIEIEQKIPHNTRNARISSTAFIIPGYLIPTTFQRDRLDGNRGGSCDRGGGFYRRFESSPFSGGGDDSFVVVIVAGSTTVASATTMVRGETRLQWSRPKRSMDSDDHQLQKQHQRRRRSTTAVLLQQPGLRWRAVQPARRSCSAVTERDVMMVTAAGAWQPSRQHSVTAKRSSRVYRYTFYTRKSTDKICFTKPSQLQWLRWPVFLKAKWINSGVKNVLPNKTRFSLESDILKDK